MATEAVPSRLNKGHEMRRRLPPGGVRLSELLRHGKPRDVWIYVGRSAWGFNNYRRASLILPPGCAPQDYIWPVNGCEVLVSDTGDCTDAVLLRLAHVLLHAGASVVRIITSDDNGKLYLPIFRQGSDEGVQHAA